MLFTSSTGEKPGQARNLLITEAHDVDISTRMIPTISEPGQHLVLMTRALNACRRPKLSKGIGRRRSMQTRLRYQKAHDRQQVPKFEDVIAHAKDICDNRLRLV